MELKQQLRGINLYLVGMMGAGKSTVGKALAAALGYRFLDTDSLIEAAAGQRVADVFAQQGEAAFRDWETRVLQEVAGYSALVVATGGGVVTRPINWSHLHYGLVVWLDVPLPVLQQRLAHDRHRPLLQRPDWPETLANLLEDRLPLYRQADVQVAVAAEDTARAVAARTLDLVQQRVEADAQAAPSPPA